MKTHGIIFDCDGTLIDSLGHALDSINYALKKIGEEPRDIADVKRFFGAAADRIFFKLLGDEQKALAAFEHYLNFQTVKAKTTKLHVGIREILDLLQNEGVPLGLVTGRHSRDLDIVLKPHNIAERFVIMVADDQLPHSKPAPDGILLATQKMGLSPMNTFYVGDSVFDVQAANAAGSVSVAALWDQMANPAEMGETNPGFMAKTPAEVWTFFKKKFKV